MGRQNEYNRVSNEDDDDMEVVSVDSLPSPILRPDNQENSSVTAVTGLVMEQEDSSSVDTSCGDTVDQYWSEQKGLSWLMALCVRRLCSGSGLGALAVLILFCVLGLSLFLAALLAYPIKLEMSLSSFQIPDHEVYTREDAFETALGSTPSTQNTNFGSNSRRRRSAPSSYIYNGYNSLPNAVDFHERVHNRWKINLVYRTRDGSNILQRDHIERIHNIEKQIEAHPRYTEFCWLDWENSGNQLYLSQYPPDKSYCYPLNSLLTYFYWPDGRTDVLRYNGSVESIIRRSYSYSGFFWYLDTTFSAQNLESKLMRSQIIIGSPLHQHQSNEDDHQRAKAYIVSLIPFLASLSDSKIQVLYGSPDIYDYQVITAVYHDIRLSIISIVLITLFVFILTSFSPFLTFICIEAVAMSLPLAYFVYRVLAGVSSFGLLNILSLFVITGIGVDDGFMFINTFRQAPHRTHGDLSVRVHYTLHTAGKATLFTSATTAAAFFGNMASGIPAVHNFGLFMGLVVVMCYLTVLVQMPIALFLWQKHSACRKSCVPDCGKCMGKQTRRIGNSRGNDDVQLMSVAFVNERSGNSTVHMGSGQSSTDSSLLTVSQATSQQSISSEGVAPEDTASGWLTTKMSAGIKRFIAKPVIRFRGVVVILFVIVFAVSVGLVTRLRTAEKPPQFFPSDSNLQQFIDLSYNTSEMNVDCNTCSASFHHVIEPPPAPPTTQPAPTTEGQPPTQPTRSTTQPPPVVTTAPVVPGETTHSLPETTAPPVAVVTQQPTFPTDAPPPPQPPTTQRPFVPHTAPPVIKTLPPKEVPTDPQSNDPCKNGDETACPTHVKPVALGSSANIYIVFGIKSLIRNSDAAKHVIRSSNDAKDTVVYDPSFAHALSNVITATPLVSDLCRICLAAIEPHRGLVKQTSDAYECIPKRGLPQSIALVVKGLPYCNDPRIANQQTSTVRAVASQNLSSLNWFAMAFKSNVFEGGSSFGARADYEKWDAFMAEVHRNYSSPAIQSSYQTSEYWKQVFLEVVAVTSALYSIGLSALSCLVFVAIFTGCPLLTMVTLSTVAGIASFVLAFFYMLGWKLGAVEAISMSILIGTAVDYCVHLVEGYLIARHRLKGLDRISKSLPWMSRVRAHIAQACQRVQWSLSHVGISIVSSALTTLFASLPLCFAQIQLLARFGQIMFINTFASIVLTSTACCALLCFQPQWRFPGTWLGSAGGAVASALFCGALMLLLYIVHAAGHVDIPAPDGSSLF
eukprot:scpid9337/ scgid6270/ Patched domain-containing protein 2; Protein dispatched homolog 3